MLTLDCAAYCRFCTRQRKVGNALQASVTRKDVDNMVGYVKLHPEVREVIFSGGDPLIAPHMLEYAMDSFEALEQIKILRVGTRLPVSDPRRINGRKLLFLRKPKQPVYVGIHFEHPDELTPETIAACRALRKLGCVLYSQSVFLKGVNDDFDTLYALFSRLIEIGVKPYYIYRCDPVRGAERFIVDIEKEVEIMTRLRAALSGMAFPTYVIDTPNGSGKVPVPLNFWQFDRNCFLDFKGVSIRPVINQTMRIM
jgi:lysine 2,3-aminomutase